MTRDEERKIIADWIMNDSDQFDLDDFGYAAADDLLSKLRPLTTAGLTSPDRSEPKKSGRQLAAEGSEVQPDLPEGGRPSPS